MSLKKLFEKASLSRRSLLKGMGAVVATAAVSGCSDDSADFNPIPGGQANLALEKADRFAFNTGPFNCGSKCVHKFHVKNGRIMAMTSAGDTPRSETNPEDEYGSVKIGEPMQFRSCVRGYSYIQRVYQPDRLKYPLLQTGEKGNISTFKRISWDEAMKIIGEKMAAAFAQAPTLGYVPVLDRMGFVASAAKKKGLTYLKGCSNASNGNYEAAKMDSVGTSMLRNSKADNMNSKFTIVWGSDPTRHSNHENGAYWLYTQSKEKGVPFVTISPVCTDQAVTYSKTIMVDLPASGVTGSVAKKVAIPGWVPIRPGTDGALALAMCYVLYRRNEHDKTYLSKDNATRKCFGFYKDDSVVSKAPEKTRSGFRFEYPADPTNLFKGKTFTVPQDNSFEEILMNLEKSVANGGWAVTDGSQAGNPTETGYDMTTNTAYNEVLEYVSKLTGVKGDIIEALAYHFAKTEPSKIDGGCGPQRQYGGAEWCWLIIAFTVMAGHAEKAGGGLPIGMGSFPDNNVFGTKTNKVTAATGFVYNLPRNDKGEFTDSYIDIMDQNLAEIIITGRDGRDVAKFKADNTLTVDTTKTPEVANIERVKIAMYTMSASNRMITHPNVNKTIEAYSQIDTVVVCDQVMTPSAAYADIVLPAATHLEDVGGVGGQGEIKIYKQNVLPKTMYQSKRQGEIDVLYKRACAKAVGLPEDDFAKPYVTPTDLDNNESSKKTIENLASTTLYDAAVGSEAKIGTWEEFTEKGGLQIVSPADKPIIGLVHHFKPGVDLETSTGYINFYSPFWGDARKDALATLTGLKYTTGDYSAGWRTPVADYVPVREGYEKFFKDSNVREEFTGYKSDHSGRTYKLQFMTNKARNRAHTCQDNVAIIKDQFEQKVYMNPKDAAERMIKDGDMVYVYNDRGCTKIRASVTHYIIPGVISVEHGAWYRAATDPKETFTAYISSNYDGDFVKKTVPVDLGGSENLLTDDRFIYDPLYINQTAGVHAGPVEVSLTKPE